MRLEIPVRSERLLDMPCPSVLGMKLNGLEIVNVLCRINSSSNGQKFCSMREWKRTAVEEHVTNGGSFFVDFEWVPCQNITLRDDTGRVRIQKGPCCDKVWR